MEITYKLLQQDFCDSIIAHRNRSLTSKLLYRLFMLMALFCLVVALINLAAIPFDRSFPNNFPLLLLAAVWIFIFWGSPRLMARNQYRKQPSAKGTKTVLLDAAGVHWR